MPTANAKGRKVGLALSGGGFRAALFHVGVLARLADLGMLRHVRVISTVSGGSIVGAAYYIGLKNLLERKPDAEITDADYRDLVAQLRDRLSDITAKNVRARVFTNLGKNFRMALPSYSRSDRIGDLYDRYLYKPAWDKPRPQRDWGADRQIELRELLIQPKGERLRFDPGGNRNEARRAKVPILLLNATTLNSGHNWRFEAVRMGEPAPADPRARAAVEEIDKNMQLEQLYFSRRKGKRQVPEEQRDFPLGLAVAASAAVPGVFHPLSISNMYEGVRVQLVDGGVQDNQGLRGLLDERCTHLVVSDASGQMRDKQRPHPNLVSVLLRSSSIYGDRIRDEQLAHARLGEQPVALMHLRRGLKVQVAQPARPVAKAIPRGDPERTPFKVNRGAQLALSLVRTDLDAFGDTEALSLMLDGYLMSGPELKRQLASLESGDVLDEDARRWDLEPARELIESPTARYMRQLRAGSKRFLRVLYLLPPIVGPAAGAILIAALIALAWLLRGPIGDLLPDTWPLWRVGIAIAIVPMLLVWIWSGLHVLVGSPVLRWLGRVPATPPRP